MSRKYVNDKGQTVVEYDDGASFVMQPWVREGTCKVCGKRFIRRAIDGADDGSLCSNHYQKAV